MITSEITYRQLIAADLQRLAEIDRTEHIETVYMQRGTQLEERHGPEQFT